MPATPICRFALAAAMALFPVFQPVTASAQTMLRLDGESCREELKLGGTLIGGAVDGVGVRSVAGRCIASNLSASAPGLGITASKLEWNRGAIRALAEGRIPDRLQLSVQGGAITADQGAEPFMRALAANGRLRHGFSGTIALAYDADAHRLTLDEGNLRFDDGAALTLSAEFSGASPLLASRPEIGALPLVLHRLETEISAPTGSTHPLLEAILAAAGANNPGLGLEEMKGEAEGFLKTRFGAVLGPAGLREALAFLRDAPRLSHPLRLDFQSDAGFALTRLIAFNGSASGQDILAGSTLGIGYAR